MSDQSRHLTGGARLVVFLGTLLREQLQVVDAYASVDFRPPASRGDLLALIRHAGTGANQPRLIIGIADGTTNGPSLPPKEVMQAIRAGAQLFGAVGDGALRAAECASYGMTGVGRIYHHALEQLVSPLDEYWAPERGGPADQSLVAWHIALEDAIAAGEVEEDDVRAFLEAAEQTPWRQRTLAQVVARDKLMEGRQRIVRAADSLLPEQRNVMRQDAGDMVMAMVSAAAVTPGSNVG